MTARWAIALLVATLALAGAGCGGDGGGNGGLSNEEKLRVEQYIADIDEFCAEVRTYDLEVLVRSINDLISIYRRNESATFDAPQGDPVTMRQLMTDNSLRLQRCGRIGRAQATKIQNVLRQS
jgi:hypothetical protein